MAPCLSLQFLGSPKIYLDGKAILPDRRRAIALLAYLAVNDIGHTRQRYSREALSGLFWPEHDQAKAFTNLRHTIWTVHQAIGESWLLSDRETVQLNPQGKVDLDVARFHDLVTQASREHNLNHRIPLLIDCTTLYRNHFLSGFSLKDAFPFNEWAYAESEALRHELTEALTLLIEGLGALHQAESAIPYARRLITLDPANEAAQRQLMEIYVEAGQHNAALKQYQNFEQMLHKELNLDPQPETRALYKKIRKGESKPVRPEMQFEIITPRHNLPSQISSFIGREKEQEEIIRLLSKNRLVTLAGVGGIGKTRISLQVGNRLLKEYPDGVWLVPLDSLSNPELVPQALALALGIREGSSDQPLLERLKFSLRLKTILLIFDNCEHVLDACVGLITELLHDCAKLKIIATSREILNMKGEATYYLPVLSLPEESTTLEKLTDYESVQLFIERATLSQSSFGMTKENAPAIVNICRKVDGIPLAIELAAARVDILQVEEILKQLESSFALLASDSRTSLPRHQTLQASMNWSWGLLREAEQTFLRQLSVFAGGWTHESAQAVCEGDFLSLSNTLVKKSLIIVDRKTGRGTRYRFHEIVRQFLYEKLAASGQEENIRTRHLKYLLLLSEQAEQALRIPAQLEWLARLNDERDNIHAALEWADKTNVEAGLNIAGSLNRYWENWDLRAGIFWLPKFLHRPESLSYPKARAKALHAYGTILHSQQQFEMLRSAAEECLALYRAIGDRKGEIDGLLLLAFVSDVISKPYAETTGRLGLVQQAFELADSIGDAQRKVDALWNLGWLDQDHRFAYWEEAIALVRPLGNWSGLAYFLSLMGYFQVVDGAFEAAQRSLDEASSLYQQLKLKPILDSLLFGYGQIALIHRDFERARACFQESSLMAIDIGNRQSYLWAQVHLGYVAVRQGSFIEARKLFAEGAQEFQKDKYAIGVVFALEGMAELFIAIEQYESAVRLVGRADATRNAISDKRPRLEQADVDKIISACIAKMGEAEFSDAYDEGQRLSLDEAVAYAFAES